MLYILKSILLEDRLSRQEIEKVKTMYLIAFYLSQNRIPQGKKQLRFKLQNVNCSSPNMLPSSVYCTATTPWTGHRHRLLQNYSHPSSSDLLIAPGS